MQNKKIKIKEQKKRRYTCVSIPLLSISDIPPCSITMQLFILDKVCPICDFHMVSIAYVTAISHLFLFKNLFSLEHLKSFASMVLVWGNSYFCHSLGNLRGSFMLHKKLSLVLLKKPTLWYIAKDKWNHCKLFRAAVGNLIEFLRKKNSKRNQIFCKYNFSFFLFFLLFF